jgi:diguanylate cyclase (GGDEF)-like protein
VLRFAAVTAIGLVLAGAAILLVVREIDQREAVSAASDRAGFVATVLLRGALRPTDVEAGIGRERRRELDAVLRSSALTEGVLRISVIDPQDRVLYSTDHRRIGRRADDRATLADVRRGHIVSKVTTVPSVGSGEPVKALVATVPIALSGGAVAVVTVEQDYGPIAAAARESLLPVAGVLEVALIVLFVLLVPSLARASRRLREHVAEIRYQATHDALTGLGNRVALHEGLADALEGMGDDDHVAVLLIDLDRFKEVNDSLGHDAGDELLRDLAGTLLEVAAPADVSRLGGDEFAVVLRETTPRAALELGHALRHGIATPRTIKGIPVSVDASVGIALAPEDGRDVGQLVRRADVAMYEAKRGRAGVIRYDAEADSNDAAKLVLMTELRAAVEHGDLEVHYQPIVSAADGALHKVEALVRWPHPTRGMVQPGVFMPLVEHTRVVVALNRFVVREAARQCAEWRRGGLDIGVCANVTVLDLLEPSFVTDVERTLRATGLPATALTLELTEGAFVQEPDRVRGVLERLRELGVEIAIDDFGTGYSSLSYLSELPVDVLKIDRSFVAGLADSEASNAIVAAAIELAHRLQLVVVAEGVEEMEQFDLLDGLGCDLIQGYLVCRPVPAADLEERIADAARAAAIAAAYAA